MTSIQQTPTLSLEATIEHFLRTVAVEVVSEDYTIIAGPTGEIGLHIVRPRLLPGPLPVVLYFHGGDWVRDSRDTHERLVRELATGAQATVVFVEYALAPETPYPIAIEQAYAATQWVATNGASIKVDPTRLAVVGDSEGGNVAAAVSLLAKERGGPRIAFQVLFCPVTDARFETASHEQLRGLPPALVITAEADALRDEGEAYAHKLLEAGVTVTAVRYLGAIHDFVLLNPIAASSPSRAAVAQAAASLRTALAH